MTLYERKLSITFFLAALLLAAAMTVFAAQGGGSQPVDSEHVSQRMPDRSHDLVAQIPAVPVAAPRIIGPYCPSGYVIAQRFDSRRPDGVIWKAIWVSKCVPAPKIQWHKRNRQLTRRSA